MLNLPALPGQKPANILFILLFTGLVTLPVFALDNTRYIGIDEVTPDMEAYCLTVFEGTRVEKFGLKIISVVRNLQPARDAILVLGTDERFKHVGAVAGCSGSPVYIDGRMAGALAAGWFGAKDPLYLVTPIEYMLAIGTAGHTPGPSAPDSLSFDLAEYSSVAQIGREYADAVSKQTRAYRTAVAGERTLDPLVTSFPPGISPELTESLAAMGFVATAASGSDDPDTDDLVPGAVLAVPLLSGDISMAATGTVTEVSGSKVYGFGHSFIGTGPVDLPMATGRVHTVVPGIMRAFKFSSPGSIVGALRFDESSGILGRIGAAPSLIPLKIKVTRYNDPEVRTYNCRMADHPMRTPLILQSAIMAAAAMQGPLPREHSVSYKTRIDIEGLEPVVFRNLSSGRDTTDPADEAVGVVGMIMNNRYEKTRINAVDVEMNIYAEDRRSVIRSVELSDVSVHPGQTINVDVLLQGNMSEKTLRHLRFTVPDDLEEGPHELIICGSEEYEKRLRRARPHRMTAYDLPSMVTALRGLLDIKRDTLYLVMALPAGGIAIENNELEFLPETRAMLLADSSRTTDAQPLQHLVVRQIPVDKVVTGARLIKITVEKK